MSLTERIVDMFKSKPFVWISPRTAQTAQSKRVRFSEKEVKRMGFEFK